MSLFQKSVLNKYYNELSIPQVQESFADFQSIFNNPAKQTNILNAKEEQYQEGFLRELFVKILGYTLYPDGNHNLITEQKNETNSKKADGAILNGLSIIAVIELKSTKTVDLASIESQAFGYKNNQQECKYVITSNFKKLRFYIDNAVEFLEFDLFNLNFDDFKLLWVCLSANYLLKNIPAQIKEASNHQEEKVTKQLYADYAKFRTDLFNDICNKNTDYDRLFLFKKTQKLLDRFLFLFFAEDRGLVAPNWTRKILQDWTDLKDKYDNYIPLYTRFRKNFDYLNTGYHGKDGEIFAYNGGLFAPDEVLDNLTIDDDLLYKGSLKLSNYDFESEVDVNILGHIFEHSLNEIDEIQASLTEAPVEKVTKRKKDGVFYTPKYITKYIVENTIGTLCKAQKEQLEIIEEDFEFIDAKAKGKDKAKRELLNKKVNDYRAWLLDLKIVDPACGSGAFLNQALEFLIEEHTKLDELRARLLGGSIVLSDVENSILENNLYGVDINDEAVEIAKLSLWLRTARKGRKLNSLNNNLKCGNSLIDDVEVAGDKAFNWNTEFNEVFDKGGFDLVIGNPPYVFARNNFKQKEKDFFVKKYVSAKYQINTYLLFIEKTIHTLKENGIYGLIIPNSWLMMHSGEGLRKFLLETSKLNQIINLAGYSFESANVETVILLAEKESIKNENSIQILLNNGNEFYFSHFKQQTEFDNNDGFEFKVFLDNDTDELNLKITNNSEELDGLVEIKAGLQAYEKGKGEPKQTSEDVKNRPYDYDYQFDENTFKYLDGKDVGRYYTNWSGLYLRYGKNLASPRTFDLFDGKKIIVREITGNFPKCLLSTYSEETYLYNRSNIAILEKENSEISLKYITAVLNSKLLSYYFVKNTAKSVRKLFPKIILNDLRKFPIKNISLSAQQPFIEKADLMLSLSKDLQEQSQKFQRTIQRKFELEDLPRNLKDWHLLSFNEFITELMKKKVKLKVAEEAEWEEYFEVQKNKALAIKSQIEQTDKQIDKMVYELYELTEEEIKIVEDIV